MNAEERRASTGVNLPGKFDRRIAHLAKHVLEESAVDFAREGKFSDANLLKLFNVFGAVFERALELYEAGRVTRISAGETSESAAEKERNSARWLLQVQGLSGEAYTIFPELNFCSCAAFRFQVIGEKSDLTCKHILAAWLSTTDKEKLSTKTVNCAQFRSLLLYQDATCSATDHGLKVTVEESKVMQGSCYIPTNVFEEFSLKEDVMFKINLNVLVECLGMFWGSMSGLGANVALELFYKGFGNPVTVLIEEDGIITDCSLKTQQPDELVGFHLDAVLNKVVLSTELLKDFLNEIDPSSELMELHLSPEVPYFRISTHGLGGLCRIELPHDSDLVDSFQCKATTAFGYKMTHIRPAMKALGCASKVSLRTNEYGLLCFQYMVKSDEGTPCYVEYFISPVIEENDE